MYGFTKNMEMAFAGAKAVSNMTELQERNIIKQVFKLGIQSLCFKASYTDKCGNVYPNCLIGVYTDANGQSQEYEFALNTELPGPDMGLFADGDHVMVTLAPWEKSTYQGMKDSTVIGYWFTGKYYRPVMKSEVTTVSVL